MDSSDDKSMSGSETRKERRVGRFDETDRKIIALLQKDGRRPYTELAKEVGLSEPATRQRVNKMRRDGLLQIVAVTDPLSMGFRRMGLIGIRTQGSPEEVSARLRALPAIEYLILATGSFDLLAEVVCSDESELTEILHEIRTISGVVGTETFIYLEIQKQTFAWGTR